jgi:hypothetical protein
MPYKEHAGHFQQTPQLVRSETLSEYVFVRVKLIYGTRNFHLTAIPHPFGAICQQGAIYMNSLAILSPV